MLLPRMLNVGGGLCRRWTLSGNELFRVPSLSSAQHRLASARTATTAAAANKSQVDPNGEDSATVGVANPKRDGADHEMKPVYNGTITTQVKAVKIFSLASSGIALSIQPYLFEKMIPAQPLWVGATVGLACAAFVAGTPLLLHLITKRYVIEIRYRAADRTFEADTYSLLLRKQTLRFSPADVRMPNIDGPITSMFVKNKPLLVNFALFTDADAYEYLLGYDKPLNYRAPR